MQVRPMRAVHGVKTIGADVDFIYGTVELVVPNGTFQSVVKLSREVLERRDLSCWSEGELFYLLFMCVGVPPRFHMRHGTRWCDVMGLYGGAFISVHLLRQSPGCISAVSGPEETCTGRRWRPRCKCYGDTQRKGVAPRVLVVAW